MPGGGGLRRQTWVEAAYNVLSNPLPLHLAVFVAHLCAVSIAAAVSDELSTAAAVSDELSTLVCTAVAPLYLAIFSWNCSPDFFFVTKEKKEKNFTNTKKK